MYVQCHVCFICNLQLSLEDVDYPSTLDYPPRIIFSMEPSKNAKPSTLQLSLTGLNKHCDFQVSLTLTKTLGGLLL